LFVVDRLSSLLRGAPFKLELLFCFMAALSCRSNSRDRSWEEGTGQ
jgi:hypothetical protein